VTGGMVWKWIAGTLDFLNNPVDLTMGILFCIGFGGYIINKETVQTVLTILRPPKHKEDGK